MRGKAINILGQHNLILAVIDEGVINFFVLDRRHNKRRLRECCGEGMSVHVKLGGTMRDLNQGR